jgi:histidinol-phosphatase (PHP family)
MKGSCAQAVQLGITSISFTEHADFTPWPTIENQIHPSWRTFWHDGVLTPPLLDVDAYTAELQRCRDLFPSLRIRFGVELNDCHYFLDDVRRLLASTKFDRVLASMHSIRTETGFDFAGSSAYVGHDPYEVVRVFLADQRNLVLSDIDFEVLAHADYCVKYWPASAGSFEISQLEEHYRALLRALAESSRVLEINTKRTFHPEFLTWWRQEGGTAVSFGSDAHEPSGVAKDFAAAADFAKAHGFHPTSDPHGFWSSRILL